MADNRPVVLAILDGWGLALLKISSQQQLSSFLQLGKPLRN